MSEPPDIDLNAIEDPALRALVQMLMHQNAQQQTRLEQLMAEVAELRRLLFGRKSEKMPSVEKKLAERQQAQAQADPAAAEAKAAKDAQKKAAAQQKRRERRRTKKELDTKEHFVALREEELHCDCGACGRAAFARLGGGEERRFYEWVPARLVCHHFTLEKAVCQRCHQTIVTAASPPNVDERVSSGPGLHAQVVVSKCADSLPLYRQAKQLRRLGLAMERHTLGKLFHRSAELLAPLWQRLKALTAESAYVNADETAVRIWRKGGCKTGYVWTFVSEPALLYVFSVNRSGQTPVEVLGESQGRLQVDAHTGYNSTCLPNRRERDGCWAHVRRKFFDARSNAPKQADEALEHILDLYAVEYRCAELGLLGSAEHRARRQALSRPKLDEFRSWLDTQSPHFGPKSPMGKAIGYALHQWKSLTHFLDDPRIALDNNVSERALRIIALGRKNWLFVGHEEGGRNLAILQTLVSSCELHGVNAFEYLRDVLMRVQSHPHTRIDELLPHMWQPQRHETTPWWLTA